MRVKGHLAGGILFVAVLLLISSPCALGLAQVAPRFLSIHIIATSTEVDVMHVPAEYATIQAAIDAANNGDQIEVAPGIYFEAINFNGKAVRLYSSSGPQLTTINGAGHYHVVQCINGEGLETVLEGFTITGAYANGTGSDTYGGGMYNYSSSPTVTNCTFTANRAGDRGGGMYNTNGSNPEVINCRFIGNKGYVRGSGMCNWSSTPTVVNCTFTNNTDTIYGGGMSNNYSHAIVTNCTFNGNSAMHCGGMHNDWSSPTVTNSIFFGNSADVGYNGTSGGMGQSNYSSPKLTNCTFSGNIAHYGGAMRSTSDSTPIITNCILWGNTANIDPQNAGPATVTYSDIQGGLLGTGNIDADPLFADAGAGDFRLSSSLSLCVDTGNNETPDLPDEDLDGNPRVMDGDENGVAVVDMGAYEVIGPVADTEPPSPAPTLSVEPNGVTDREITLVSTEAFDPSGVEYYFECLSGPGHDSGWLSELLYTDTSLAPETSYAYRVKARDGHYNETLWSPTIWVATREVGVMHVPAEYVSIQAAIDDANNGDQIEVAPGIYYGGIDFKGKAVRVYSSGGPQVTIINGSGYFHVVQCVSGEGPDTILQGFTLTGGNADDPNSMSAYGGGMLNDLSSPTVTGCIFKGNTALVAGGGMYNRQSSPTVTNCTFTSNTTGAGGDGGGMFNGSRSSPSVTDCNFVGNSAGSWGGGMCNMGGAVIGIRGCTFSSNIGIGGGMHNYDCRATVVACAFIDNETEWNGGGMVNQSADSIIVNCIFSGNTAGSDGGGMWNCNSSRSMVTNCTFTRNSALLGAAMASDQSASIVMNCILWGDMPDEIHDSSGSESVVVYSNVQGGWPDEGNIDADPLFADAGAGDFRLLSSASPCVDAGDNEAPSLPDEDFGGNPRVVDGDGNGSVVVDMGAYEAAEALPDTEPPSPNPRLSVEPNSITPNQITLICTEAFDPSGVEYYFECVSGPGHDSGWVPDPMYTDTLLEPEMLYAYRVKARDGLLNETSWSSTLWTQTPREPAITDGLLGYWPMEDGYGSTVSDWSGNGNNGFFSVSAQPVWQPSGGQLDGALLFDGQEGHVVCPADPDFDFQWGVTVMAWIKTDSLTKNWQAIITKGDTAWRLHRNSNTPYINFACTGLEGGNMAWGSTVWGNTPVVDNEWHHVAGVYDPDNELDHVKLYVDGILDGPDAVTDGWGPMATNTYDVLIGANAESLGLGWNGLIDDVRLYNEGLTEYEIAYLLGEYVEPDRSLIAHWKLDESSGTIAADSSFNGHDGFFNAGPSPQWVAGRIGVALMFPGGEYVDCGNSSIFDVTEGVTVAAWIKITTVPADWTAILTKGDDAWRLATFMQTTRVHFGITGPPDYWSVDGDTGLDPGQWYHIVGTYDGSYIRLYLDGIEDAEPVAYDGGITTSPHSVRIGGNPDRPGSEFDGVIDEAAVWERALSLEEIQWIAGNQIVQRYGIFVDDDAPGDPAPGDPTIGDPNEDGSWQHPFDSIQEGIDAADETETVTVLDGIYTGWGNRNLSFEGKPMVLRSENGPENCIIDCERMRRGFVFGYEETPETVLEGFTIANGRAYTEGLENGGGIYCYQSNPTITECIIRNCEAREGGGIYLEYCGPTIDGCAITGNTAVYSGAGLGCWKSSPTLADCTISNNSPDGIALDYGLARISGTVKVISDSIGGDGSFQIDPDATLQMEDANTTGYIEVVGLGRILVPTGKHFTVAENTLLDLTDGGNPGMQGTLQCDGLLVVTDAGSLTRTTVDVTRAVFEGNAIVSDNVITTNVRIPYGQISVEDSAIFFNNEVYSNGDRYIDIEPAMFNGAIENNRIFVTAEEGRGNTAGGLFELRGEDMFCEQPPCEPGLFRVDEVPDFEPNTWTIERLELHQGAELTLTNRDDYQPPYDQGGETEVLYVKHLVLGENSVLDTAFKRVYYESLTMHPTAEVTNRPLLGYSLDDIVFDDPDEYLNRVGHNNLVDPNTPELTRIFVARTTDSDLDPSGLMVMNTLPDLDPTSPTYEQILPARAKALFARCNQEMVMIRFYYNFQTDDPNVALEIYLSDVPDLLEKDNLERLTHYRLVGILTPPPYPRPGAVGSNRFAVFEKTVPTNGLDLTDGTYVELELLQSDGSNPMIPPPGIPFSKAPSASSKNGAVSGTSILIDDWGPEVHCDGICGDLTQDQLVNEVDFLTVVGECGLAAELDPCDTGSRACLEGAYSDDAYVDVLDITGWDWTLGHDDRGYLCEGIPLTDAEGAGKSDDLDKLGKTMPLATLPSSLDDLLIIGKRKSANAAIKMQDSLYVFDSTLNYSDSFAPSSNRSNLRIVEGPDDKFYQVNSEDGVVRLDATDEEIIPSGVCTNVSEPRYETSGATVYVGIQLEPGRYEEESFGRPILDAAFDADYAYVVPVVVKPVGKDAYVAAARLQLLGSGTPPYRVDMLYDDPPQPADNQYRNALREIELDDASNAYVINAHGLNESNILWRYEPNGAFQRVELGVPGSNNHVPDPVALYVSSTTDMLYMASGQHDAANYRNSTVYGFTTKGTINRTRKITVMNMHHVTGITEDPTSGTLYVVGFNMDNIPQRPNQMHLPFYEARYAKIPYAGTSETAQAFAGSHDLAMPMSILWTKTITCGGANIGGSDTSVNYLDVAIMAQNWLDSPCSPPDWCGGADINMSKAVGLPDFAILADNWLQTGCTN